MLPTSALEKLGIRVRGDYQGLAALDSLSDRIGNRRSRGLSEYNPLKWDEYKQQTGLEDHHRQLQKGAALEKLGAKLVSIKLEKRVPAVDGPAALHEMSGPCGMPNKTPAALEAQAEGEMGQLAISHQKGEPVRDMPKTAALAQRHPWVASLLADGHRQGLSGEQLVGNLEKAAAANPLLKLATEAFFREVVDDDRPFDWTKTAAPQPPSLNSGGSQAQKAMQNLSRGVSSQLPSVTGPGQQRAANMPATTPKTPTKATPTPQQRGGGWSLSRLSSQLGSQARSMVPTKVPSWQDAQQAYQNLGYAGQTALTGGLGQVTGARPTAPQQATPQPAAPQQATPQPEAPQPAAPRQDPGQQLLEQRQRGFAGETGETPQAQAQAAKRKQQLNQQAAKLQQDPQAPPEQKEQVAREAVQTSLQTQDPKAAKGKAKRFAEGKPTEQDQAAAAQQAAEDLGADPQDPGMMQQVWDFVGNLDPGSQAMLALGVGIPVISMLTGALSGGDIMPWLMGGLGIGGALGGAASGMFGEGAQQAIGGAGNQLMGMMGLGGNKLIGGEGDAPGLLELAPLALGGGNVAEQVGQRYTPEQISKLLPQAIEWGYLPEDLQTSLDSAVRMQNTTRGIPGVSSMVDDQIRQGFAEAGIEDPQAQQNLLQAWALHGQNQ